MLLFYVEIQVPKLEISYKNRFISMDELFLSFWDRFINLDENTP
jgi:hypothetical protein